MLLLSPLFIQRNRWVKLFNYGNKFMFCLNNNKRGELNAIKQTSHKLMNFNHNEMRALFKICLNDKFRPIIKWRFTWWTDEIGVECIQKRQRYTLEIVNKISYQMKNMSLSASYNPALAAGGKQAFRVSVCEISFVGYCHDDTMLSIGNAEIKISERFPNIK